jgi:hypothetical protein
MSRARDLAAWNASTGLVDITSSFTRSATWTKSGTERVLHDPNTGLVYYNLGLYIDATDTAGSAERDEWVQPLDNEVIYTIASAYRPSEQFITSTITGTYDSTVVAFASNGDVTVSSPQNWEGARFRIYINGWYKI